METWARGKVQNKLTRYSNICQTASTDNYWTPLTEQVEDSESKESLNHIIYKNNQAVFDTAATSSAEKQGIPLYQQQKDQTTYLMNQVGLKWKPCLYKLKHDMRDPARRVDMVPDLAEDSLISGPKFAEAGYVTLLTPKELLIFDGHDLKITVSKEAVL